MKEKKEVNIQIGRRIHEARERAGYTQEKLAEKIEVSVQYISDLERGVVGASLQTMIRICHTLSVSSDYILMGHTDESAPFDFTERLRGLSPEERRLMEANINLMLEAFQLHGRTSL